MKKRVWYPRRYDAAQAGSIDGSVTMLEEQGPQDQDLEQAPLHDHGLLRAITAQQLSLYQHEEEKERRTLFVSGLDLRTTESRLSQYFSTFGGLSKVNLLTNIGCWSVLPGFLPCWSC